MDKVRFFQKLVGAAAGSVFGVTPGTDSKQSTHEPVTMRTFRGFALVIALLSAHTLWGQSTSRITGTVTDSSGADVAGAQVTLIDEATKTESLQNTQRNGIYEFPSLTQGTYTVQVVQQGFDEVRTTGVVLDVSSTRVVDFTLRPGTVTQTVEVQAQEQQVDTQSAVVGTTIDNRDVEQIQLNGRYFQNLVETLPGSTATSASDYSLAGAINGLPAANYTVTLDGANNTNIGGTVYSVQVDPTLDAIDEVRVQTDSYLPELGGRSGAQINVTIKSGGNKYHGDVYEYLRNSLTDARGYFATSTPALHYNDWGGTIGGPIPTPASWNMKGKLFFFISQEKKTVHQETAALASVPTPQMLQGNFANQYLLTQAAPLPNYPGTNTPFPNGVVPKSMWSVNGPKLLSVYANLVPNYAGPGGNYSYNSLSLNDTDTAIGRIDYIPNSRRHIAYTDSYDSNFNSATYGLDGIGQNRPRPGYTIRVADTETVSPTVVIVAALNITHSFVNSKVKGPCFNTVGGGLTYNELFPSVYDGNGTCAQGLAPAVTIAGTQAFTNPLSGVAGTNEDQSTATPGGTFDLTKVLGNHTLKFGANIERIRRTNFYFGFGSQPLDGTMTFSNQNNPNTTGNSIADALLGNFASYQEAAYDGTQFARSNEDGFYAQDSWTVTKKLHIDYGVRYSYIPWYHFVQNDYDSFNPALFNPAQAPTISATNGTITSAPGTYNPYNGYMLWGNNFPHTTAAADPWSVDPQVLALPRLPSSGSKTDWADIGPRIGIAYDVFGNGKTAIRSGFGVFYDRPPSDSVSQQGGAANPPFQKVTSLTVGNIDNPAGGTVAPTTPVAFTGFAPINLRSPSVYTYNLDIQQQLPFHLILDLGYVGNQQRHLLAASFTCTTACSATTSGYNIDALPPGTKFAHPTLSSAGINSIRPYLGFSAINQNSYSDNGHYNSLQSTLSRRFSTGLSMSASFTWANGMTQTTQPAANGNSTLPLIYVPSANYNKLAFVVNAQYQLPFAQGSTGFVHAVAAGWILSTLYQARDGSLQTISINGDPAGIYATSTLAALSGNPNKNAPHTVSEWYNTSVVLPVSAIPNGTFSTQYPGGALRGPGTQEWDQSIFKDFQIHEHDTLEFRVESFNLPNHPSWTTIGTNASSATFGQVTAASAPRVWQGALKFRF